MHMILFTFLFAIKKPPKPQSAHVKRQTVKKKIKKEISQYTNIVRQSYPGNGICGKQPYIKIKVVEKPDSFLSETSEHTYAG